MCEWILNTRLSVMHQVDLTSQLEQVEPNTCRNVEVNEKYSDMSAVKDFTFLFSSNHGVQ